MINSPVVSGLIVEAGTYLLLLFTPLAFGGVEGWALGVFQILAAVVFVAWALGGGNPLRRTAEPSAGSSSPPWTGCRRGGCDSASASAGTTRRWRTTGWTRSAAGSTCAR